MSRGGRASVETARFAYLGLIPDAIPYALRCLPWVLWRAEPRGEDKPAKVPYRIAEPDRRASSTDSTTWGTFGDAVESYGALADLPAHPSRGPVAGIGVGMTADYGAAQRLYIKRGYVPDGRGLVAGEHHVSWGETVRVDDDLVLYFTKPV